ncbi:polysaccharide deacetylase family protein [Kitasatospora sp. NPDC088346]|uniref:polysaccharide deacetylase family protein n=1 Tax=Kitasatospora sp. NPDC088346 TaxID=3364073 RepID=UPI00380185AE
MAELLREQNSENASEMVGLTFDDGYLDFYQNAFPRLRDRGFGATVYIISGLLGSHNEWDVENGAPRHPLMTADQVLHLAAEGVDVGCHGRRHARLTDLPAAAVAEEVWGSRADLENLLGKPVDGFCYPYGAVDSAVEAEVRAAGFGYACTTNPPGPFNDWTIPRSYVGERDGFLRMSAKRACRPRYMDAVRSSDIS